MAKKRKAKSAGVTAGIGAAAGALAAEVAGKVAAEGAIVAARRVTSRPTAPTHQDLGYRILKELTQHETPVALSELPRAVEAGLIELEQALGSLRRLLLIRFRNKITHVTITGAGRRMLTELE